MNFNVDDNDATAANEEKKEEKKQQQKSKPKPTTDVSNPQHYSSQIQTTWNLNRKKI